MDVGGVTEETTGRTRGFTRSNVSVTSCDQQLETLHHGVGALLFLTTGRCTKMVDITSSVSLDLPLLVFTNWSASKCACRVTSLQFADSTTHFYLELWTM
ncbi:hypothetical protein INR49_003150 [Caranx melampygus]|nr:hypothetical protein INR49_003150 [Caranx melampygus]